MDNCIFCKIVKKEIPADIIEEDENFIVFSDVHPKAKYHFLIVPKKHLASVNDLVENNEKELAGNLILMAGRVAEKFGFARWGYKLVINVGRGGGQEVDHLHLHLLSDYSK